MELFVVPARVRLSKILSPKEKRIRTTSHTEFEGRVTFLRNGILNNSANRSLKIQRLMISSIISKMIQPQRFGDIKAK